MEKKTIKDLKRGEYFTLNPIEEPQESQVWVDETDESIAKAYLIDRVKDTRETIIKRTIDRTIY